MKPVIVLIVALVATATACGADSPATDKPSTELNEPRSIEVIMTDMAYTPAAIDVPAGQTVVFTFRNDGAVRHEAVVGDLSQQEAHHAEMTEMAGTHDMGSMDESSMDEGSMGHDGEAMTELHSVVVDPGETVEMTHTFESAGATLIGCHEPGHWEAGMKMDVSVT